MGFYHRDGRHLYINGRHVFVRGDFYGRTVNRYVTFTGFQFASGTAGADRSRALGDPIKRPAAPDEPNILTAIAEIRVRQRRIPACHLGTL
jgi:hypothetical protein